MPDRPREREDLEQTPDPELVETGGETVDGDFNGAPALEALERTSAWEGTDVLEAMEGREAEAVRDADVADADEVLADVVAERRQVLVERYDEARELGLEDVVDEALAASEPSAPETPVVADEDVLRDQLARIDTAIDHLERRSTERGV